MDPNTTTTNARSATDLVKEAKQNIQNLSPEQVRQEMDEKSATLIDLRESEELQQAGRIPGAVHVPRGLLEFHADPTHPYHKPEFDRSKRIILHCASGGRSALAAQTLEKMGYQNVAHLDGGITAWKGAGLPIVE
jgi:rhodanese-related sulfurtransferase